MTFAIIFKITITEPGVKNSGEDGGNRHPYAKFYILVPRTVEAFDTGNDEPIPVPLLHPDGDQK